MPCDVIIVRYDEIALKSPPVRARFEKMLVNRIKTALSWHGVAYSGITREWGRIFVHTDDVRGADVIARVFGTASTSPAVTTGATIDDAAQIAARIGRDLVRDGESFAIRASRSGIHDFTSIDLGRVCGDAVSRCIPCPRVDLTHPDREIFVDMRQNHAYVYTKRVTGVGGLPYGSQGKMIALMSGGIDSPVAAWLMMKRGVAVVPLHCDLEEFGDPTSAELARESINRLKSWAYAVMKAYTVPYGSCLRAIQEHCDPRAICVICKRMMYRIGAAVAEREGACGIITGSSLGQVASQTARNMF
ncbi:MAG TPA: tRNA sulfurtransferase, partial [Methanosarcinales archaeon]|nr:tRNA sulfurtransferase [Methanosarcinales archaeon]